MNISPIALFTYNRPWHTRRTVEALQKNDLAEDSSLFIFSDGPKNRADRENVLAVRSYIRSISGFKEVVINERESNWGLADSITDGVTRVINDYGRVVVLEDDLLTGPAFLRFMNDALVYYRDQKKVWHISGWNYPISPEGLPQTFLWRVMNCWGWATWADRWQYYGRDPEGLIKSFTRKEILRFNLEGSHDFWDQARRNAKGRIKSWAIFWYATIFMHNGLCLNPTASLVQNFGRDGSGMHCGSGDKNRPAMPPAEIAPGPFQEKIEENAEVVDHVKKFFAAERKRSSLKGSICRLIMNN